MTSEYAWKVEFVDSAMFNVQVRFESGISVWDKQFFKLNNEGKIELMNWNIDWSDLADLSDEQLRIVRNRVFAKHGYIFKSNDLSDYFSRFEWYNPRFENVDSRLTEEDKLFLDHITNMSN